MIRQAISPRLAIRIRLNMSWLACNLLGGFEAIWRVGADVTIPSYSKTQRRQRPGAQFVTGSFRQRALLPDRLSATSVLPAAAVAEQVPRRNVLPPPSRRDVGHGAACPFPGPRRRSSGTALS